MKRVLVICGELLLGSSVECILSRESDLILRSTIHPDEATLREDIETFKPDVIILDENFQLANLSRLIMMLRRVPAVRLLVLSITDNRVHVYDKQDINLTHFTDFVRVVH